MESRPTFHLHSPLPAAQRWRKHRVEMVLRLLPVFIVLIAVGVGAWQIKQVREFFGQASGEPANLVVNTQAVLGPLPRPWRNLAQGGEDHAWRMGGLIPQVKALKPEYIRIDHIYDFYDIVKGSPGNLSYDFSKLDGVLDDIAATGAKPYIALSYMPPVISKTDILDVPQRWEDWQAVVRETIKHVSGARKTSDVYYEVWNEPDLFGKWYYGGSKNYMTLYTYAARGAVEAQKSPGVLSFKIGGPAITAFYRNWFKAFLAHCLKNNLRLDFFSWHRYALDINQYKKDMVDAQTALQEFPQYEPTLELHITEWGHDSNVHPGYDNVIGAAHTVAGSIEMLNVIQRAFVFEIQDGKDPQSKAYWGRWGIFTHNDFGAKAKDRYRGLKMLDRISDQRLQLTGKGTWVKAVAAKNQNGNTEVVLANYGTGSTAEKVPLTFTNITPGSYTVTREYLNGTRSTEKVATSAATLQTFVPMGPNGVAFVTFAPVSVEKVVPPAPPVQSPTPPTPTPLPAGAL